DMPNVPKGHLVAMRKAMTPDIEAVMTRVNDVLCPPAIFSRKIFPKLIDLTTVGGARHVFQSLSNTRIVDLNAEQAQDIDGLEDLAKLNCC
ncbi:MAG: xanthine dehydrogenase, partial [Pseudomonadota bacterium]